MVIGYETWMSIVHCPLSTPYLVYILFSFSLCIIHVGQARGKYLENSFQN